MNFTEGILRGKMRGFSSVLPGQKALILPPEKPGQILQEEK
jgi:hypothetical protein